MKNIAIIPARSGSKGLKDKNIKPLLDIPLLAYSIRAAKDSALFDEIMVSTDSHIRPGYKSRRQSPPALPDRKSTRLNSSHRSLSRMPSSA